MGVQTEVARTIATSRQMLPKFVKTLSLLAMMALPLAGCGGAVNTQFKLNVANGKRAWASCVR